MKKQQLIIALSASMLLMSCGVNDNSSPKNVKASDFTTCFNANTSGSITKNNNVTSTGNFFSDLNTDHFSSIISYDGVEKSLFYEKNSEGGGRYLLS